MARKSRKKPQVQVLDHALDNNIKILRTVAYVRLSEEDERKIQSDSVENQIAFLKAFVADKPYLQLTKVYTDRGITGTKFDRPAFNELISDMRAGKFDCIVVKDFSRLGRNYLEAGEYLEKIFPFFNIRFISVTDQYDSAVSSPTEDGLIVPLKNLINEAYAKDISRKISTAVSMMQKQGKFVGGIPPFGYLRDPEDKHHLVVDETLRDLIVRLFTERASGKSLTVLARELNEEKVPSPMQYRISMGFEKTERYKNVFWTSKVLKSILVNRVYVGDIVAHKVHESLYEGKKWRRVPKEERLYFQDVHEAIVDRELFDLVNDEMEKLSREFESRHYMYRDIEKKEDLFKGLLFCGDCGTGMGMYRKTMKLKNGYKTYNTYICKYASSYRSLGDTSKSIKVSDLEALAVTQIRQHISIYLRMSDDLRQLNKKPKAQAMKEAYQSKLADAEKKFARNQTITGSLYEDYADGILSETDYLYAKKKYVDECAVLENQIQELKAILATYEEGYTTNPEMDKKMHSFDGLEELTAEAVKTFISRINCFSKERFEFHFKFQPEIEKIINLVEKRSVEVQ